MTTNGNAPKRVLIFGDFIPTGFGRICRAVAEHLVHQGYEVMGACIQYDGLLPLGLPYHVASLQGKGHAEAMSGLWAATQPDVILSAQDFPYHIMLRQAAAIDWSTTAHVVITPVDGVPVAPDWIKFAPEFDALMSISEFGVQAFREAGVRAELCPPGVDTNEFKRLPDSRRAELRAALGIPAEAFVVGMMAMNQGRKDYPRAIESFAMAFPDVPNAYLYLDCDKVSPSGWDIEKWILEKFPQLPLDRVRFREDAGRVGLRDLNERYNLLDVHMVISKREGFGLPHIEAQATGIPTLAIDYCSAREIIGNDERGVVIKAHRGDISTWGGAWDYDADREHLAQTLRHLYEHPAERAALGERALAYAKTRPWSKAGEATQNVIERVLEARAADIATRKAQPVPDLEPMQQAQPAGVIPPTIIQLHAPVYVNGANAAQIGTEIAAAAKGQVIELVESQQEQKDSAA